MNRKYKKDGFFVTHRIFDEAELFKIESNLNSIDTAGERIMLDHGWCRDIALNIQSKIACDLEELSFLSPVQCTYFCKDEHKNWLVTWHQDRSLPLVDDQKAHSAIRVKEGRRYHQPTEQELSRTIAIRLSIDDSHARNGGLKVIPSSHVNGILSSCEILSANTSKRAQTPHVLRGCALVMSPLLLHASSKADLPEQRRVLHFTYN